MDAHRIGEEPLTLARVQAVAEGHLPVHLSLARRALLRDRRRAVDALLAPDAPNVYGINTGFGALAEVRVEAGDLARLQVNLIRSHATGVGTPYDRITTRAMMLLRANVLCIGTSGVRPEVPALLVDMLNAGIHPLVPQKGSVGASGDLAPLAHLALALIGEGEVEFGGALLAAGDALEVAGLTPLTLAPKEGLALINGTQAMTADAIGVVTLAERLARSADIIGALTLEAQLGTPAAFDSRVQRVRNHPGQCDSARNLRRLLEGSGIVPSHAGCGKVQDPYSLRCMPQVHGASRDVFTHVAAVLEREANAATDNPLMFVHPDDGTAEFISGGNFHGQPVALAADYLGMGLAELANISERRIEQLVNPALSSGLPAFLAAQSGLNSGFMIAQVTAAALVSENKVLAHPASVDSIPSSANREDHVSMGTIAARKARQIADHVATVLAIELLCAAQGIEFRRPLQSSPALEAVHARIRSNIPALTDDRILHPDIAAAKALVMDGALIDAVTPHLGPLD